MSETAIGTCSNCGGIVTLHTGPWFGVNPPTPTCSACGATPALPVIQMGNRQEQNKKAVSAVAKQMDYEKLLGTKS